MNKLWVIILFGFAVFAMVKARSLYTTNYQVQKANQVGSSNKITSKHDLCSASSSSSSSSSSEESDGCNCNDEGTHLYNQEVVSKDSSSASSSFSLKSSSVENYDKKIGTANTKITISKIDSNSSSSPSSSSSSSSEENLPFSHSPSFHGDHGHSGESSPSSSSEE